jgi:ABC-type dipeptide/oligopeptide/nickel transport system ATPase subunit
MTKKKKYRGHYCKVCGCIKPNEKFTGKGHKNHICKKCNKLSSENQKEKIILNKISRVFQYPNLSRNNKKLLKKYLDDPRENIQKAAKEILESFTPDYSDIEADEYFKNYYANINEHIETTINENKFKDNNDEIPF